MDHLPFGCPTPLAWTSFGITVTVALLGFTMFARWVLVYCATAPAAGDESAPAERHLPLPVVVPRLLGATTSSWSCWPQWASE
ncbi:hypothetical protein ACIBCO_14895 [Streptomyces violascens]|uniref:hypothetical protein n=1 Tax=Streptomyces violascens TaxID=67381 RepID=UPI00378AF5A6